MTAFRCVICLKNVRMSGRDSFIDSIKFWIPHGEVICFKTPIAQDETSITYAEHYLTVCPDDYKYVQEHELVARELIRARLKNADKDD